MEKLEWSNYASWSYTMHQYLLGHDYWSYVEGANVAAPENRMLKNRKPLFSEMWKNRKPLFSEIWKNRKPLFSEIWKNRMLRILPPIIYIRTISGFSLFRFMH